MASLVLGHYQRQVIRWFPEVAKELERYNEELPKPNSMAPSWEVENGLVTDDNYRDWSKSYGDGAVDHETPEAKRLAKLLGTSPYVPYEQRPLVIIIGIGDGADRRVVGVWLRAGFQVWWCDFCSPAINTGLTLLPEVLKEYKMGHIHPERIVKQVELFRLVGNYDDSLPNGKVAHFYDSKVLSHYTDKMVRLAMEGKGRKLDPRGSVTVGHAIPGRNGRNPLSHYRRAIPHLVPVFKNSFARGLAQAITYEDISDVDYYSQLVSFMTWGTV